MEPRGPHMIDEYSTTEILQLLNFFIFIFFNDDLRIKALFSGLIRTPISKQSCALEECQQY